MQKFYHHIFISIFLIFLIFLCNFTDAGSLPPGFAEILVAQNLDPTAMALSPDGRLFITEKNGKVLIVENGQLFADPFAILDVDKQNERGLQGIAFDPHFEHNGYVYLYYTVKDANHNRISRFVADGNYAVPGSETIIMDIDQLTWTIHNGGSMAFGLDEKLYVSTGDGADGDAAQSLNSLLGKIIRINADGTIPEDNPFYNQTSGKYRAIYAIGLRNSFSMSIQPGTGRIFATEVGSATWEEVNEILPGMNYGWPIIEGPLQGQTPPANYKEPVHYYHHNNGCAIVGAAFYNPDTYLFPSIYAGKFFFADYCFGYIKYLDPANPSQSFTFAEDINRPLNIIVAPDGTMYYLARAGLGGGSEEDNTSTNDGTLWRVFYTGSNKPFVSANPQSLLVSQGDDARFIMAASGQQPLSYQWQQNGIDIPGANSSEFVFPNAMLSDSGNLFRTIVCNIDGCDTTLEAELRVTTNKRPEPEILTPIEGTMYRAGDTLFFSGNAFDNELGILGASSLRWKIDFHHNVHTHPALVPTTGMTEGEYVIPKSGETSDDVWYRIYLTAIDDVGLSKTVYRDIYPVKTQFHIHTIPSGIPVYVESDFTSSPVTVTSVVGIIRNIEAVPSLVIGDSIRIFLEWLDGVTESSRTFEVPDDTLTFTSIYETIPLGQGTGVRGYYYDWLGGDPEFVEPFKFTWIDTTINFDWGDGSPAISQLGADQWLVRWEGYVEPLFDGIHNFHIVADDGIRLWIDGQQIIDAWVLQPPTEWTGTINLDAGKLYPLRLEFFEDGGGAVCEFSWSNSRIVKSIVPRHQLYPEEATSIDPGSNYSIPLFIYPNPASDKLHLEILDSGEIVKEIGIQNAIGQLMFLQEENLQPGVTEIDVHEWGHGIYFIQYNLVNGIKGTLKFVKI